MVMALLLAAAGCASQPADPSFGGARGDDGTVASRVGDAGAAADSAAGGPETDPSQPGEQPSGTADPATAGTAADTAPDAVDGPKAPPILRGDIMVVDVFGEEELSRETEVDEDGTVNLPWIGQVEVAGLTKIEAQAKIASLYTEGYIKAPMVTVDVRRRERLQDRQVITVMGEVDRPGVMEIPPDGELYLSQAISLAGGFTDVASERGIRISRLREDGTREELRSISFSSITTGRRADEQLQPGDIVTVKESVW